MSGMNGEGPNGTGPWTVLVTDKVSESGLAPLRADDRFEIVKIDDSSDASFSQALPGMKGPTIGTASARPGKVSLRNGKE